MKIFGKRLLCYKVILVTCAIGLTPGMSAQNRSLRPTSAGEFWKMVKDTLSKPDSDAIFRDNFKDVMVPVPVKTTALEGVVISATPENRPARIVLALSDGRIPEATIDVPDNIAVDSRIVKAGAVIQFRAVIRSFTRNPFMVTLSLESPRDIGIDLFHQ